MSKPVLYLIDGSSQMYRAYHAPVRTASGGLLRNSKGQATNAVYIFVTMLRKLLNEHKPEYIAASFDLPGRTFRDDLASDYKANRAPMPDELAEQIPMVHAACEALGVPILTSERYEADDVIGTLADKASAVGFEVAIEVRGARGVERRAVQRVERRDRAVHVERRRAVERQVHLFLVLVLPEETRSAARHAGARDDRHDRQRSHADPHNRQ